MALPDGLDPAEACLIDYHPLVPTVAAISVEVAARDDRYLWQDYNSLLIPRERPPNRVELKIVLFNQYLWKQCESHSP